MEKDVLIRESDEVGRLLKRLDKTIGARVNQLMAVHGVTESLTRVLGFLESRQGEETCQLDIQNALQLTNPAVTKLVVRLEEKGLIAVSRKNNDQRYKIISLTERGIGIMQECKKMKEPLEMHMLEGFSIDEVQHMKDYLNRLYENVNSISIDE